MIQRKASMLNIKIFFQTCCKEVDYLFKVDDDMFVQVDKLISMLEKKDKKSR